MAVAAMISLCRRLTNRRWVAFFYRRVGNSAAGKSAAERWLLSRG
jgi:hypothetical protein